MAVRLRLEVSMLVEGAEQLVGRGGMALRHLGAELRMHLPTSTSRTRLASLLLTTRPAVPAELVQAVSTEVGAQGGVVRMPLLAAPREADVEDFIKVVAATSVEEDVPGGIGRRYVPHSSIR